MEESECNGLLLVGAEPGACIGEGTDRRGDAVAGVGSGGGVSLLPSPSSAEKKRRELK